MIRYILKRLVSGLILLFIYASLLFFAVQIILPGDYVSQFSLGLTTQQTEELRESLNLHLPLMERYAIWLKDLLQGDLGNSFTAFGIGEPVMDIIKQTLPITLLIFGVGTALAFVIGLYLGRVAAWRGSGLTTTSITFFSIAFYTSFPPWLAFLFIHFLAFRLGLPISMGTRTRFRTPGMSEADIISIMLIGLFIASVLCWLINRIWQRWRRRSLPGLVIFITLLFLWLAGWRIMGIWDLAIEIMRMAILPIIIYALLSFGEIVLIMRTSMTDTLQEDYIQTARAKGLPSNQIRDRHAARNALLPVFSKLVINLPFLLAGMAMIEEVLSVDGIGTALFYAVGMQNITLTMGMILVIGVVSLLARLFLDILQAVLDPRVRRPSWS